MMKMCSLRGLPTLPIPKRSELYTDRLFWMKMSIMNQQQKTVKKTPFFFSFRKMSTILLVLQK